MFMRNLLFRLAGRDLRQLCSKRPVHNWHVPPHSASHQRPGDVAAVGRRPLCTSLLLCHERLFQQLSLRQACRLHCHCYRSVSTFRGAGYNDNRK